LEVDVARNVDDDDPPADIAPIYVRAGHDAFRLPACGRRRQSLPRGLELWSLAHPRPGMRQGRSVVEDTGKALAGRRIDRSTGDALGFDAHRAKFDDVVTAVFAVAFHFVYSFTPLNCGTRRIGP
jgi:hypothetical protein